MLGVGAGTLVLYFGANFGAIMELMVRFSHNWLVLSLVTIQAIII